MRLLIGSRTHCLAALATIYNVTDDGDRQTDETLQHKHDRIK